VPVNGREDGDHAEFLGKLVDRAPQELGALALDRLALAPDRCGARGVDHRHLFARLAAFVAAPPVERQAPRHPDKPAAKPFAIAELVESLIGLRERFLRDVFGVLLMPKHTVGHPHGQRGRVGQPCFELVLEIPSHHPVISAKIQQANPFTHYGSDHKTPRPAIRFVSGVVEWRTMTRATLALLASGLLTLGGQQSATPPKYDDFVLGSRTDVSPKTRGGLVLAGGGTDQPAAFEWLIDHAGGGDIVIIRASGTDAYNPFIAKLGKTNSVETIVFRDRAAAADPAVLERLRRAEAVFLAGGDQGNYIKYWKDTPVEDAINALAARGVPVGGTSAGLAVLSQFSFAALNDSITSVDALADPYSPKVTIERDFLDMPFLKNVITDSHFVERDRMGRTLAFLARMTEDKMVAGNARSIAIDARTAVLVEADGTARVVGGSTAYFLETTKPATVCAPKTPLSIEGITVYRVPAGGTFDLKTWTGAGGTAYTLAVDKGLIRSSRAEIY
jgi:cyanophycinase